MPSQGDSKLKSAVSGISGHYVGKSDMGRVQRGIKAACHPEYIPEEGRLKDDQKTGPSACSGFFA
jgi:hypothetical protein